MNFLKVIAWSNNLQFQCIFFLFRSKRCVICNETFVNLPDLKKHMNQVHNEASEPLKCQICGLVLPTMRGLHKHRCQKRCDRKVTKKSSTSLDSSQFTGCYMYLHKN